MIDTKLFKGIESTRGNRTTQILGLLKFYENLLIPKLEVSNFQVCFV